MANRVYSYGLVPIGYPPREAIDVTFREIVWLFVKQFRLRL